LHNPQTSVYNPNETIIHHYTRKDISSADDLHIDLARRNKEGRGAKILIVRRGSWGKERGEGERVHARV
jgi:hypothetical protein